MKTLLHVCCAPCSIYPLDVLRKKAYSVTAYFNNPNIHPYKEFKRRLSTLQEWSKEEHLPLVANTEYGLTEFLRKVVYNENSRCRLCYTMRLEKTVDYAKSNGFEAFSTTLLYSKYQNHTAIVEICRDLAARKDLAFVYEDYREGWKEGIEKSIEKGMYRQPYCGCIYSEQERYDKRLRKKRAKKDAVNDCHRNNKQKQAV